MQNVTSDEISFVVQGTVSRRDTDGTLFAQKCLNSIRLHFPNAEIIISTWKNEPTDGLTYDKLITSDDPGAITDANGEMINVNRQLVSTRAGLAQATRKYAVKFRADLIFADSSFCEFSIEPVKGADALFTSKIRMTNLFIQNPVKMPFLFHLSDIAQFGETADLIKLWDIPNFEIGEILNLEPEYKKEWGSFWGGSLMRMRPEQAMILGFLKKQKIYIALRNSNQTDFDMFNYFERILTRNFEVIAWEKSGILFPQRMMDSFLETVYLPEEIEAISRNPQGARKRYRRVKLNKYFLFIFNRAYLFHLKKSLVASIPVLRHFFSAIKKFHFIFFGRALKKAEKSHQLLSKRLRENRKNEALERP